MEQCCDLGVPRIGIEELAILLGIGQNSPHFRDVTEQKTEFLLPMVSESRPLFIREDN